MNDQTLSELIGELLDANMTLASAPDELKVPPFPDVFMSVEEMEVFKANRDTVEGVNYRLQKARNTLHQEIFHLEQGIANQLPYWDVPVVVQGHKVWKSNKYYRTGVHLERITDEPK